MPTPPTLISYTEVAWNTTGSPKTTASISWQAGDVIVVVAGSETADTLGTPTATGLTFTKQKDWPGTGGTTCAAFIATATPGSSGSATVSVTESGAHTWGFGVWVWRGSAGVGNSAEQHTSTKTVALTPTGADSAIVWGTFDFAAAAVQTITPAPSNTRQRVALTPYTIYVSDLTDQVSAGSVSYGISGAGTGPFSIVAVEVKGTAATVSTSIDGDEQSQRFSQMSGMESQHQHELSETFAILPQRPPFAYEDDGANMRWSDWRALLHEDPETHRALPPIPPVSIQEEFTESVWVDWRARQFEDTDTHRALPPTPPFAIQDEHADEKNFNWSAIQYDATEMQRSLPPTPPSAIQDEISDRGLPGIVPFFEEDQAPKPIVAAAAPDIGLDDAEAHIKAYDRVNVYHEDDLSTFAPTPPVSIQDDEQHTWRAWSSAAIEDDWRALPPTPPFVVPDDTAEKWTATSAPAIEDDQATIPPVPPIVPFSIQDDEQHSWRGWLTPHIEADWTTAAPAPPFAFEDDLKTISSNPVFFSLVETDMVGIPPLPRFFGDDERSLQRYMVAGLSGLILLDDFVNAPIATGLGPFTLTSLSASVRPGIDSLGAAVRSSMESQGAVIRPGIDSLSAAIRASMESKGAAVRPGIDSAGAIVRPS